MWLCCEPGYMIGNCYPIISLLLLPGFWQLRWRGEIHAKPTPNSWELWLIQFILASRVIVSPPFSLALLKIVFEHSAKFWTGVYQM